MLGISKSQLEVTPIVAYGGIFVATVFAFMGLESFWRHENALAEKVVAAQNELATKETLSESDEWAARFEQSRLMREATLSAIWTGATGGVIAAELQQALRKKAQGLGFEQVQVKVDPSPIDVDHIARRKNTRVNGRGRREQSKTDCLAHSGFQSRCARSAQTSPVLGRHYTCANYHWRASRRR